MDKIVLIIPLVLIDLGLMAFALYNLVKRDRVRGGNKLLWGLVIALVGIVGPIVYLVFGRGED